MNMQELYLNGQWEMRELNQGAWISAKVPGSVYADFLSARLIQDAYYRDNEKTVAAIFEKDYEYRREFTVGEEWVGHDAVELCFQGIDTLAEIRLNETLVGAADNMHCSWRFDVKKILKTGKNILHVILKSPVIYAKSLPKEMSILQNPSSLRKASCMFGWDWGLSLPDSGIWRDVTLEGYHTARIGDVKFLQRHNSASVDLELIIGLEEWKGGAGLIVSITAPSGEVINAECVSKEKGTQRFKALIHDPALWWPNGQGSQPLYAVAIELSKNNTEIEKKTYRIGLRTIKLLREKDVYGRGYTVEVNGRKIFIKGANMVIEDAVLSKRNPKRTETMIQNCVEANFNAIRVWGGANYPENYFYELCDIYGILVYQDFMFACNLYPVDDIFIKNITTEITQVIKQLRHHPCIALWCGNNEVELIFGLLAGTNQKYAETAKSFGLPELSSETARVLKKDILKLFYEVIPSLTASYDPERSYVPSSPSGEEPLEVPDSDAIPGGDSHYYPAFDNLRPYREMTKLKYRFISEMGFQSYPDWKTIESFTRTEDRGPYTPVMLQHQKSNNGNQVIDEYIKTDYKVPEDFKKYVYASQNIAGTIMAYSVEHFRRLTGFCMGVLIWQLNDCWPAVSWAGIDYYGRWKAQQYYLKRAFAPVLISASEEETKVGLVITNDTPDICRGIVSWELYDTQFSTVKSGETAVSVEPGSVCHAVDLDFAGIITESNKADFVLHYAVAENGVEKSAGNFLFVKPKDYAFKNPAVNIEVTDEKDRFKIKLDATVFVKSLALSIAGTDCIFSDNYFDMIPGKTKEVSVKKETICPIIGADDIKQKLEILSAFDLR
jgi:beta-mannosidase